MPSSDEERRRRTPHRSVGEWRSGMTATMVMRGNDQVGNEIMGNEYGSGSERSSGYTTSFSISSGVSSSGGGSGGVSGGSINISNRSIQGSDHRASSNILDVSNTTTTSTTSSSSSSSNGSSGSGLLDVSNTSSGSRVLNNRLYAHAYSSFQQQQQQTQQNHHHHQPIQYSYKQRAMMLWGKQQQQQQQQQSHQQSHQQPVPIPHGNKQSYGQAHHGQEGYYSSYSPVHFQDTPTAGIQQQQHHPHHQQQQIHHQQQQIQKRRVRSVLLLAALAFMGMLVLDGLVQFHSDPFSSTTTSKHVDSSLGVSINRGGGEDMSMEGEGSRVMMEPQEYYVQQQQLLLLQQQQQQQLSQGQDNLPQRGQPQQQQEVSFLRRLMNSLLDDGYSDGSEEMPSPPHHRSYDDELNGEQEAVTDVNNGDSLSQSTPQEFPLQDETTSESSIPPAVEETLIEMQPMMRRIMQAPPTTLHTLPLLPKHALQHRQRRELIIQEKPILLHLQEGQDDVLYHHENWQRRRRGYPVMIVGEDGEEVIDARRLNQDTDTEADTESINNYETGALYQGYGTHYLDLWVGSPPQRQTVIIDTGSSVTAFPCSGCKNCGSNPTTGERYHLDDDFDTSSSSTYRQKECKRGHAAKMVNGKRVNDSGVPCDLGTCTSASPGENFQCQIAVSYAEGSTWTAVEGSDVVYPAGPHEEALSSLEDRVENGVGVGMGNYFAEEEEQKSGRKMKSEFDWMDFRLKFGCQKKVTGLFQTQLEDGIMGMDNRKGAFWLQLHEHYKQKGFVAGDGSDLTSFDPSQFSLCYDRQPLSMDLRPGVGSGALTLGGTDPLLHNTDMVFASNITPTGGWYHVRIKAVFLRTKGGTLSEPHPDPKAVEYVRVDAKEDVINGNANKNRGVILDSGTTDSYLPLGLKGPFDKAWAQVLGGGSTGYSNSPKKMTPDQVKSLPTILFVLKGHAASNNAENNKNAIGLTSSHKDILSKTNNPDNSISSSDIVVAVPPSHYMEESHREPGVYTARIYFTERFNAQSILGSNFLMGHEILFDNRNGRIGFAESHCDYSRYVEERDARRQQQELLLQPQAGEHQDEADPSRVATQEANAVGSNKEAQPNIENDLAASGWAR